ncbi:MAG: Uma2 family endonuclease [Methylacidiphilales bacterium]|nr:Uma2 family endonuclease [Candidatus Methylacidiphilales bacterium]NJR17143.1 Uma2 family endonuclease [Calothrix sp. CSU_2_0]
MVIQSASLAAEDIIYPESDGQPMADNTKQFELIVLIKKNFDLLFANNDNVFVAGDLFWYPVKGDNNTRRAPDVMVVFGRPKGDRGSYLQWKEENIIPQVVFEILSPGNTHREMIAKYNFYQRYGVEEYYLYDPETGELTGWLRAENELQEIAEIIGSVSPRLGVRFEVFNGKLQIFRPDGQQFLTYLELDRLREQERERAEQAESQLQALRNLLKSKGINPDEL